MEIIGNWISSYFLLSFQFFLQWTISTNSASIYIKIEMYECMFHFCFVFRAPCTRCTYGTSLVVKMIELSVKKTEKKLALWRLMISACLNWTLISALGRNGILLQNSNLLHWIRHKFLSLFLCSDFRKDQMHLNKFKI